MLEITLDYIRGVETIHLAFFAGVVISYLYYKKRSISVGGSLAVGYLAGSLLYPVTVLFTIVTALVAYILINYVVLRIWLPRPRQIFAIGLFVGIILGGIWLAISRLMYPENELLSYLAIVGVIIPGMLCNSFIKQGLKRTIVPLVWMVPVAFAFGLAGSWLLSKTPGGSLTGYLFEFGGFSSVRLFALSSVSVVLAIVIQEGPLAKWKLRTGGYVTAGILLVTLGNWPYFFVIISAAVLTWLVGLLALRVVPLHGKDRFVLLLFTSAFFVTVAELIVVSTSGERIDGAQNLVLIAIPAVISNDLIQHGARRTGGGMALAFIGTAIVGAIMSLAA